MADVKDLLRDLKFLRDELQLKMHLASLEVKGEWQDLEGKWHRFSSRAGLDSSAESVGDALELLGEELLRSYRRLKAAIKD